MSEKQLRLPPHSIEAEAGVLGCVLLDPAAGIGKCLEVFGACNAEVPLFYEPRHQILYEVLVEMFEARRLIDVITLQERLGGTPSPQPSPPGGRGRSEAGSGLTQLEQVGGLNYLVSLQDNVPSAANLEYYAAIVLNKWRLRRMLQALTRGAMRIYNPPDEDARMEADAICAQIEAEILAVNDRKGAKGVEHIKAPTMRLLDRLENYSRGVGLLAGVRTGFSYFDKMTGGLHERELILIAARPGSGKTTLMMNIVEYVAITNREPVLVITMEMGNEDLVLRTLCAQGGADMSRIRTGFMNTQDEQRIISAAPRVAAAPIFMHDGSALDIMEIRATGRRYVHQENVKLIVIDYAQLAQSEKVRRSRGTREQEVAAISGGCKAMAKELGVPVVLLSQLNREMEKNHRRPQLSDLKESGALEQDADLIAFLWSPKLDDDAKDEAESTGIFPTNLTVAKQRNGPTGDCALSFLKTKNKFVDGFGGRGKTEGREIVKKVARQEMPTEADFEEFGK